VKPVGKGVSELRIDHGPGYRLYITQTGPIIVVLLCGGSKGTQAADIEHAHTLAKAWRK
jgi:putative addiction module killer protein